MCLAIPGQIIEINNDELLFRKARVTFGSLSKDVSLACLPDAKIGDYVLVHAGIGLSIVDTAEAQRIFALLDSISADDENNFPSDAP